MASLVFTFGKLKVVFGSNRMLTQEQKQLADGAELWCTQYRFSGRFHKCVKKIVVLILSARIVAADTHRSDWMTIRDLAIPATIQL